MVCLILCLVLNGHVHLGGVWLVENMKMDTKKTIVEQKFGLHAEHLLIILDIIVHIVRRRDLYVLFNNS